MAGNYSRYNGRLFRWPEDEKLWEDKLPVMIRKELDAIYSKLGQSTTIIQSTGGTASTPSNKNSYILHINTIVELQDLGYVTLGQNYGYLTQSIRHLKNGTIGTIKVNYAGTDGERILTTPNKFRVTDTLTLQSTTEGVAEIGTVTVYDFAVRFGLPEDGDSKIRLRIRELQNDGSDTDYVIREHFYKGTVNINSTELLQGKLTLLLEMAIEIIL